MRLLGFVVLIRNLKGVLGKGRIFGFVSNLGLATDPPLFCIALRRLPPNAVGVPVCLEQGFGLIKKPLE
jgi:hypothetical protein